MTTKAVGYFLRIVYNTQVSESHALKPHLLVSNILRFNSLSKLLLILSFIGLIFAFLVQLTTFDNKLSANRF